EDWPRPDVTTLNGRRLFYSHIDGDGMRNVSEVRPQALSGEIIHDEILSKVPLPISVSVVVAEVDPELLGSARTQGLARAMFALPNVEAASHSFTHPLDWEKRTRSFDLPRLPYSVETFKSTESPRRVSPVNVYYHFYSGERVASLAALRVVYDWARRQPVAPVFTSEYLAMVEGFRTARVARAGAGYRVWDHGALRTIR